MAAIHWGAAQWPIDENNEQNRLYNGKKRECYTKYARAGRPSRRGGLDPTARRSGAAGLVSPAAGLPRRTHPGRESRSPAWTASRRWASPCTATAGSPAAWRCSALDGPGQYESPVLDIYFSMPAWIATGTARRRLAVGARAEIDREPHRASPATASARSSGPSRPPTSRASARSSVSAVCHEPGFHTIFEEASPTFKMRFMYMSGITDEARVRRSSARA